MRLALARFQPRALLDSDPRPQLDLRLSSVVLADFVQTAPDRALTLTRDAGGPGVHRVHVSGASYSARRTLAKVATHAVSQMLARLERRAPEISDEALAWSPLPGVGETLLAAGALGRHAALGRGRRRATGSRRRNVAPGGGAARSTRIEEYQNDRAHRTVYVDMVAL